MNENINIIKKIKKTILMVDDEFINLEILKQILMEDYDIITAENGLEALDALKTSLVPISVILLDINMPVMNGIDFLKEVKQEDQFKKIPVIVLTSEKQSELTALELGAADFIAKPYDMPAIVKARVRRSIELSEDRMIIQASERDELTGAYNRPVFIEYANRIDKYILNKRTDMVVIALEKFNLYTELYGESASKAALRSFADILKEIARKYDGIVARLATDYFAMYLGHQDDYDQLIESIYDLLEKRFGIKNIHFHMGIYETSDKNETVEYRIGCARLACEEVRNSHKKRYFIYDNETKKNSLFKERLLADLQKSIQDRHLEVYYQPKVNIQGDKFVLSSAEALIRWNHPEFGFISPGLFIPLFEENGSIKYVDEFVLKETVRQVKEWKDKYGVSIPVSINISRIDMLDNTLPDRIYQVVSDGGLTTDDIHLEITESAYTQEMNQAISLVEKLKEKGFTIEIDDFGCGYSSLNAIATLPFDVLKLDMIFVRDMFKNEKTQKMVAIVSEIAKLLKVKLVAEGVETLNEVMVLKEMGYDVIQGYYFSKPVKATEFEKFIGKEFK